MFFPSNWIYRSNRTGLTTCVKIVEAKRKEKQSLWYFRVVKYQLNSTFTRLASGITSQDSTINQGRGRRLLKFSYMHHPTKNDVTSGLNWASQLASQSEKMAFRLFKISLCLWTICFVSVYNEDGKIFQAHTFNFLSKNFWKREQFRIVLKENNGDPSVIEWRILHTCKTDVAQTFGSCRSWFSDNAKCNSL